jgi:hypothetical protein
MLDVTAFDLEKADVPLKSIFRCPSVDSTYGASTLQWELNNDDDVNREPKPTYSIVMMKDPKTETMRRKPHFA